MISFATDKLALLGLVLAGGKSSRMQKAKAHLVIYDVPQWQACQTVLASYCEKIYFSVSPLLNPPLPVSDDHLIHDIFTEPIGPLGGIISAFKKNTHRAFFVLACDLPFFNHEAAKNLFLLRNHQKKATVYMNKGEIEPLCGIYEPSIFPDLLKAFMDGRYCPRAILSSLDVERVEPQEVHCLTNINHAHELTEIYQNGSQKIVTIYYYASLREKTQCSEEQVVTSAQTIKELFSELKQKYLWSVPNHHMRFAKNERLVGGDSLVESHDALVFIPPVSGG
jgi:molybdopterin-guanine dinucleotide biosynthesis protein A